MATVSILLNCKPTRLRLSHWFAHNISQSLEPCLQQAALSPPSMSDQRMEIPHSPNDRDHGQSLLTLSSSQLLFQWNNQSRVLSKPKSDHVSFLLLMSQDEAKFSIPLGYPGPAGSGPCLPLSPSLWLPAPVTLASFIPPALGPRTCCSSDASPAPVSFSQKS